MKISQLLAYGLGEAGGRIIMNNMKGDGDLNPMMPGEKTYAIFGFCYLNYFTETTEALEEDIMTYVNQIAEMIHSIVDLSGGATNKNIGEAFLMVWKFYDTKEIQKMDEKDKFDNKKLCNENLVAADMAVFAILKILAKNNKYEHILNYKHNKRIIKQFGHGYKVKLTFGLHQGWAIEGAIGSFFKVDASYLSPNVNMASRLCAATKQFGTEFLISNSMHDILSDKFKSIFREIDRVTVKGSIKPIRLYTVKLFLDNLMPERDVLLRIDLKHKKDVRKEAKRRVLNKIESEDQTTWNILSNDQDFKEMRRKLSADFEKKFYRAYKHYILGDWQQAAEIIEELR